MVQAQRLEDQLVDWLRGFRPDKRLRKLILDTINAETADRDGDDAARRRELLTQLERLRDLYLMGDLTKAQYVLRRQAFEEELQRAKPPTDPDLDRAQALLDDFARFWETEPDSAERRKLLTALFDHIWQKDGTIVAVKPQAPFARYFTAANQSQTKPPKGDRKSGVTKAGATGVRPPLDTASRSGCRALGRTDGAAECCGNGVIALRSRIPAALRRGVASRVINCCRSRDTFLWHRHPHCSPVARPQRSAASR